MRATIFRTRLRCAGVSRPKERISSARITDSPSSRIPGEIADFVFWNCSSGSQSAAERWLDSLREEELDNLMLGDVRGLLQPGSEDDVEKLAIENENEKGTGDQ